jgi:hypothetical protein
MKYKLALFVLTLIGFNSKLFAFDISKLEGKWVGHKTTQYQTKESDLNYYKFVSIDESSHNYSRVVEFKKNSNSLNSISKLFGLSNARDFKLEITDSIDGAAKSVMRQDERGNIMVEFSSLNPVTSQTVVASVSILADQSEAIEFGRSVGAIGNFYNITFLNADTILYTVIVSASGESVVSIYKLEKK